MNLCWLYLYRSFIHLLCFHLLLLHSLTLWKNLHHLPYWFCNHVIICSNLTNNLLNCLIIHIANVTHTTLLIINPAPIHLHHKPHSTDLNNSTIPLVDHIPYRLTHLIITHVSHHIPGQSLTAHPNNASKIVVTFFRRTSTGSSSDAPISCKYASTNVDKTLLLLSNSKLAVTPKSYTVNSFSISYMQFQ